MGQTTRGGPPVLTVKNPASYEMSHRASELASSCEELNEPPVSLKVREFLD